MNAMKVMLHPTFIKKWKRYFFGVFLYFGVSLGGVIYLGNHGFLGDFGDIDIWFVFISNLSLLIGLGAMTYFVRCPLCHGSTVTKSLRKELPDYWSAHCRSCDVLWNLELGNSD